MKCFIGENNGHPRLVSPEAHRKLDIPQYGTIWLCEYHYQDYKSVVIAWLHSKGIHAGIKE